MRIISYLVRVALSGLQNRNLGLAATNVVLLPLTVDEQTYLAGEVRDLEHHPLRILFSHSGSYVNPGR